MKAWKDNKMFQEGGDQSAVASAAERFNKQKSLSTKK